MLTRSSLVKNKHSYCQILLTEQFDEGLMVMRRMLGWGMIDMTYARMMETKSGTRRWDGKELKDVPHFEDLTNWVSLSVYCWPTEAFFSYVQANDVHPPLLPIQRDW